MKDAHKYVLDYLSDELSKKARPAPSFTTLQNIEPLPISVCITTKNNAETIRRCVESVHEWTDEIIVIDSNSQDGTRDICEEYGATVYQREFQSFAQIKMEAVSSATNDWVFILDADEEVPPELRDEIIDSFGTPGVVAFYMEKQEYMLGARTHQYHVKRPYLARKGVLYYKQEYIWERLSVKNDYADQTRVLRNRIDHYRFERASEMEEKIQQYSALEALQTVENGTRNGFGWFFVRGIAVAMDRLVLSKAALDGYRGFFIAFLEFYQLIVAYVKMKDIYRLQEQYPDRWKEIWTIEECQR
ncbi:MULTISPECIES: glycosyltransferase family 2 protein [Natrialbaceae]|uniref:glycosyltransferase family 2 protein n=1 Tax=Natrialbaceae TaxID=1644061 RepID=UPI00207C5211|nr:glycosyltransferase family 2 protein [Natronococcus sp. CG52]